MGNKQQASNQQPANDNPETIQTMAVYYTGLGLSIDLSVMW